jgi:hypothetical protein
LVRNKTFIKFAIIFSFLTFVLLQSCYLFCLFRPDNMVYPAIEPYVEEDLDIDVLDDPSIWRSFPDLENEFTL